jgi:hypothetical protein
VNNNYYRFTLNPNDTEINIPIEITFDMEGREQAVEEFEKSAVQQVLNGIEDFEIGRFAHAPWDGDPEKTEINYIFNFFNPNLPTDFIVNPPSTTDWLDDYEYATFTNEEIYYFSNAFKGSFFKLDFYDSKVNESQKILFSVILPTQQGQKETGNIGPPLNPTTVMVKKPKYILDYTGQDKEGFFFYWLKNEDYISQTDFYMSCKFFNAKKGQFVRMINEPQSSFVGPNQFNFNKENYFYYKVTFDYSSYEYKVYRETLGLVRVGVGQTATEAITWYEYINP